MNQRNHDDKKKNTEKFFALFSIKYTLESVTKVSYDSETHSFFDNCNIFTCNLPIGNRRNE